MNHYRLDEAFLESGIINYDDTPYHEIVGFEVNLKKLDENDKFPYNANRAFHQVRDSKKITIVLNLYSKYFPV